MKNDFSSVPIKKFLLTAVWWKNRTEYSKPYICWIWVILNVLIVLVLLRGNWDEATGPTSKKCSKLCGNGVEIWGRRIWRSFTTTPVSYMTLKSSEVQSLHRVKTPSFSFFTFKKIVKIRPGQNANYHDYQIHEIFTSDCRTFPNIPETGIYLLYINNIK